MSFSVEFMPMRKLTEWCTDWHLSWVLPIIIWTVWITTTTRRTAIITTTTAIIKIISCPVCNSRQLRRLSYRRQRRPALRPAPTVPTVITPWTASAWATITTTIKSTAKDRQGQVPHHRQLIRQLPRHRRLPPPPHPWPCERPFDIFKNSGTKKN